jgi:hypothetical protein
MVVVRYCFWGWSWSWILQPLFASRKNVFPSGKSIKYWGAHYCFESILWFFMHGFAFWYNQILVLLQIVFGTVEFSPTTSPASGLCFLTNTVLQNTDFFLATTDVLGLISIQGLLEVPHSDASLTSTHLFVPQQLFLELGQNFPRESLESQVH